MIPAGLFTDLFTDLFTGRGSHEWEALRLLSAESGFKRSARCDLLLCISQGPGL